MAQKVELDFPIKKTRSFIHLLTYPSANSIQHIKIYHTPYSTLSIHYTLYTTNRIANSCFLFCFIVFYSIPLWSKSTNTHTHIHTFISSSISKSVQTTEDRQKPLCSLSCYLLLSHGPRKSHPVIVTVHKGS